MSDMSAVIVPKSDQINADDLIGGDLTITITGVTVSPGQEQPVSMKFEGSTKVFRPCKSMARVMVAAWGPDSSAYVGRSLQLYRDPTVKWGGLEVGGIRIRKMTDMPDNRAMTMALTATKGQRKPYIVHPLIIEAAPEKPASMTCDEAVSLAKAAAAKGTDAFREWFNSSEGKGCRATGALTPEVISDCKAIASGADNLGPRIAADEDPFGAPAEDATPTPEQIAAAEAEAMAEVERRNRAHTDNA
jgi:hypothetical protein